MKKFCISVCLSLLCMKGLAATKPVILYSDPYQYVTALSANGKWACGTLNDGTGSLVAFVWNLESNELKSLGTGTIAYGISNNGVVVGSYPDSEASTNGAEVTSAGYWSDGKWHHLELPNGLKYTNSDASSIANCISPDGRFIGGSIYSATGLYSPVIWDNGKFARDLSGGYAGSVYAVTDDGSKAGGWTYTKESGSTRITVMWDEEGNRHFLTDNISHGSPYFAIQKFSTDGNIALMNKVCMTLQQEKLQQFLLSTLTSGDLFFMISATAFLLLVMSRLPMALSSLSSIRTARHRSWKTIL